MIGKIWGLEKLRINIDGPGITTLVGMYNCPLNCEYCINNPITHYYECSVEELFNELFPHSLYFEHSGGGICFGGHEPLLQQKFILEFIKYVKIKKLNWLFGLETSLNAEIDTELLHNLNYLIVDIKDINNNIYKKYTEKDNSLVLKNLKIIRYFDNIDVVIRVPKIPGYNTDEDIENSINYLKKLGYSNNKIEVFTYKTEDDEN